MGREEQETEEHKEESDRGDKSKDQGVKERIRIKCDEDKIEQWFKRKGLKISHTTIWKVLEREGEKSWRKKNKKPKARKRFERAKPNELWQIDIKTKGHSGAKNNCRKDNISIY